MGLNGAGKTLKLEDIQKKKIEAGKKCVSNLKKIKYKGLDQRRVDIVTGYDAFINIFDYREVREAKDSITSIDEEYAFSQEHLDILTLLCRPGDILILNEPDFDLDAWEVCTIRDLLCILNKTYEEIHIVTHCKWLFPIAEEFYWVKDYKIYRVSEEDVYAHIGKI